jgi:hypothetical protein
MKHNSSSWSGDLLHDCDAAIVAILRLEPRVIEIATPLRCHSASHRLHRREEHFPIFVEGVLAHLGNADQKKLQLNRRVPGMHMRRAVAVLQQ